MWLRTEVGRRLGLVAACLLALWLGRVGLGDEGYVSLQGDMPRHLMNGVYLLDVLRDRPFGSLDTFLEYTQLYFARYPALSLGHHPPLLHVAEVPPLALLGPSVAAGRTVTLIAFVAATALLYILMTRLYGTRPALVAAALFATSPLVVELSQSIMSEILAIALLLAAAVALQRFCATGARPPLIGFVVASTLSLYAKQLAIFVFPAFLVMVVVQLGWRRCLRRDLVAAAAVMVFCSLPLVALTIALSPSNITAVVEQWARPGPPPRPTSVATDAEVTTDSVSTPPEGSSPENPAPPVVEFSPNFSPIRLIRRALAPQLTMPALIIAGMGVVLGLIRRDAAAAFFVCWIGGVLLGMLAVGQHGPARYSIYWVPAFAALAGTVATLRPPRWAAGGLSVALIGAVAYQGVAAVRVRVEGAGGYEETARLVLASDPGPTVLFNGEVDTGFFTFFVRKHDPDRRLVVLRADKLLTTSYVGVPDIENRIEDRSEIYDILERFGTRYVVIEDRPMGAPVLEWLREEVHSERFVERHRIPVVSRDPRLVDTSLVIYEFLGATEPDDEAVLSMGLPIIERSLEVRLSDLIAGKYLR